jgi:hypothetical protein
MVEIRFFAGPDGEFPFLREVAAKLDSALTQGRFYQPLVVDLEPGDCPECHKPFEERTASAPAGWSVPFAGGRRRSLTALRAIARR